MHATRVPKNEKSKRSSKSVRRDQLVMEHLPLVKAEIEAEGKGALHFQPFDGLQLQRRAVVNPEAFDVLVHWSLSTELAWTAPPPQPFPAGAIPVT